MCTFRPGKIVADLIVVGRVLPRLPTDREISAGRAAKINFRNAVENVGAVRSKDSVERKVRWGRESSSRRNVDPISVVVEGRFVQQIGPNEVSRMNHALV